MNATTETQRRRSYKGRSRVQLAFVSVYFLTYVCLSVAGKYRLVNHGGSDWSVQWHPKYLARAYVGFSGRTKSRLTRAGVVFLPCILADRCLWHRTGHNVGF
jgi:hypothetical protein